MKTEYLVRILGPIAWLVLTFFPINSLGIAFQVVKFFPDYPTLITGLTALWTLPFMLCLPLARLTFQYATTGLLTLILGIGIYKAFQVQALPLEMNWIVIVGLVAGGIVLAWLTVSIRVWRWARGMVAVDDADTELDQAH